MVDADSASAERELREACAQLERCRLSLEQAERAALERRRAHERALRSRYEEERRDAELAEAEAEARAGRQRAEARANAYRAAATFAQSLRTEAERAGDVDAAEHERQVEERARSETVEAEGDARQELGEEQRLATIRAGIAMQLASARDASDAAGRARTESEEFLAGRKRDVDEAADAVRRSEAKLQALLERSAAEKLDPAGTSERRRERLRRERERLETKIAELAKIEADVTRERAERERKLAALVADDVPAAALRETESTAEYLADAKTFASQAPAASQPVAAPNTPAPAPSMPAPAQTVPPHSAPRPSARPAGRAAKAGPVGALLASSGKLLQRMLWLRPAPEAGAASEESGPAAADRIADEFRR